MKHQDTVALWATKLSDDRVEALFRKLQIFAQDHPEISRHELRFAAMTVALSDMVDVFAFCVGPEHDERQIGIIVDAMRGGVPIARAGWNKRIGEFREFERQAKPEFEIRMVCPHCGAEHVMAGSIEEGGRGPEDGDVTMCIRCGELGAFDKAAPGGARKLTIEELANTATDESITEMRRAWKKAKALEEAGPKNPNSPWGFN
jgi:hypothetical protein